MPHVRTGRAALASAITIIAAAAGTIIAAAAGMIIAAAAGMIIAATAGAAPVLAATGASRVPSVVLCAGYGGCARHDFHSYGYGRHRGRSYWQMSPGNECTNYVAYVESRVFGVAAPGYLLGNAVQWPRTAAAHGVVVNKVPSVGAVAVWSGRAYGMGRDGHVAVVQKVGPHDSYIVISQQHLLHEANGYDWTRINAGYPARTWQSWPSDFIHFRRG